MQFNRTKLQETVLYICAKCTDDELGAVKLHKALYYSDMLWYAAVGNALTGATYRKRPFGPTCEQLLSTIRDLSAVDALKVSEKTYFGYVKKVYEAKRSPDLSQFSSGEIDLIDDVIDFVCAKNTAKTISEFSHSRAWESAEFGDTIPYSSVFLIFPNQVSPEALAWGREEASRLESEGSLKSSVGDVHYPAFRSRVSQTLRG